MSLRITTFNLKNPNPTPTNSWPQRRKAMAAMLEKLAPDLLGTQEGTYAQLAEINSDQDGRYTQVGQGRDGGDAGESTAILFRSDRFELLAHGDFWLSETPDVPGSMSWNTAITRMVTWARLRDTSSDIVFTMFNSHFDHESERARVEGAKLLRVEAEEALANGAVVITGDFNAQGTDSEAAQVLTADGMFADSWEVADQRNDDAAENPDTFHAFTGERTGKRIDWILVSRHFAVPSCRVDRSNTAGQYPSDHFPVTAELTSAK